MSEPAPVPPFDHIHFVGVAGTGMSALAQYLGMRGIPVSGSDRRFSGECPERFQLEACGITCFPQDGSGITEATRAVVVSTAIESGNPDTARAQELGIPLLHRSELLAAFIAEKSSIAVSGTSGKSTVSGMMYHILERTGHKPSFLGGAGLVELERKGLIGNAVAGSGKWLVAEVDESDGTLVRYHPEVGVVLNIDKDHKEFSELEPLFCTFAEQVKGPLVSNLDDPRVRPLSHGSEWGFHIESASEAASLSRHPVAPGFTGVDFCPQGFASRFTLIHNLPGGQKERISCTLPLPGEHNMQNALAAIAAAHAATGVPIADAAGALADYAGIHRRHQLLGIVDGIALVDDYAHNPAKIAAGIRAVQGSVSGKVLAWWQPHGFGPTRFLRHDLCEAVASVLRDGDSMWYSDIYYAGGTVVRDISSVDLANDLKARGKQAICIGDRKECFSAMLAEARPGDAILLMGARDPGLSAFAEWCKSTLHAGVAAGLRSRPEPGGRAPS